MNLEFEKDKKKIILNAVTSQESDSLANTILLSVVNIVKALIMAAIFTRNCPNFLIMKCFVECGCILSALGFVHNISCLLDFSNQN